MTWNYRVIKYDHRPDYNGDEPWFAIHEVYYDEDGKPTSVTENASTVSGEDLKWVVERMQEAVSKPVLNWTDIVKDDF